MKESVMKQLLFKPMSEITSDSQLRKGLAEEFRVLSKKHAFIVMKYLHEKGQSFWTQMMFDLKLNPNSLRRCLKPLREYDIVSHNQYGFYLTEFGTYCLKYAAALTIKLHDSDRGITEYLSPLIKD